jgi:hypothetical protein
VTDQERIAELERRVYALEAAIANMTGIPSPYMPQPWQPQTVRGGCAACEWGKRACGCVLNAPIVTCVQP